MNRDTAEKIATAIAVNISGGTALSTTWQKCDPEAREAFHNFWIELILFWAAKEVPVVPERAETAVGPISPADVGKAKQVAIPPEVFAAFNKLIAQNFNNGSAVVKQEAAVQVICSEFDKTNPYNHLLLRRRIFEQHWLDVEDAYRAAGWTVVFDKPGYNETYDASFIFRKKR